MARKFYTCIIVPDTSAQLHKLRIPIQALYVLAVIGVVSFLVAVALGFNYARMAFKVSDYNKLQAENSELKVETKNLEVSAIKLNSKITALESLSERLTKTLEGDSMLRRFLKPNVAVTAGGSKKDLATAELLSGNLRDDVEGMRERTLELEGQLQLLQEVATHHANVIRFTPSIWPLQGRIGSSYGRRRDPFTGEPEVHMGLDIVALLGSPVKAPADGVVLYSQRKSEYGNLIILDHGNGLTTRHGHLSRFAVRTGQQVHRGDVIGYVGMTGRTTGPHLHYEVRQNDRPVNPRNYLPRGD